MKPTFIIEGNLYTIRREIASRGGVFSYELKAYVMPNNEITRERAKSKDLDMIESDIVIDEEYRVKQKNIRAEKRSEKRSDRADRARGKQESLKLNNYETDFLSLGEPIKVGHHSEHRHRKLIEKSRNLMGKRVEQMDKEEEAERISDYRKNKKYLTKAEKAAKKEREKRASDLAISIWKETRKVGDMYNFSNRDFEICKINQKSVTIPSGSRREIRRDNKYDDCLKKAKDILDAEKN